MYSKLVHVRIIYLYCLTVLCIGALIVAWFLLLYQPSRVEFDQTQLAIDQLFTQKQLLKKSEQELVTLSRTIAHLQEDVGVYMGQTSYAQSLQITLASIADIAMQVGLQINACRLCGAQDQGWCTAHQITTECKGTIDQIIAFFDQLKKRKQLIECSRCEIARGQEQTFLLRAVLNVMQV